MPMFTNKILRSCACDVNHVYELRIKKGSESDHRSCEGT